MPRRSKRANKISEKWHTNSQQLLTAQGTMKGPRHTTARIKSNRKDITCKVQDNHDEYGCKYGRRLLQQAFNGILTAASLRERKKGPRNMMQLQWLLT
eukprot:scaffold712_cov69-Cyclotella_meneghiniana.AAC.6